MVNQKYLMSDQKTISFKCSTYHKNDPYQWKKPYTNTSQQFIVCENKKLQKVLFFGMFA